MLSITLFSSADLTGDLRQVWRRSIFHWFSVSSLSPVSRLISMWTYEGADRKIEIDYCRSVTAKTFCLYWGTPSSAGGDAEYLISHMAPFRSSLHYISPRGRAQCSLRACCCRFSWFLPGAPRILCPDKYRERSFFSHDTRRHQRPL